MQSATSRLALRLRDEHPRSSEQHPTSTRHHRLTTLPLVHAALPPQATLPGLATSAELCHTLRRRGVLLGMAGSAALLSSPQQLWHLVNLTSDAPIRWLACSAACPLAYWQNCREAAAGSDGQAPLRCSRWQLLQSSVVGATLRPADAPRCSLPLQPGRCALGPAQKAEWQRVRAAAADALGSKPAGWRRLRGAALLAAGA